MGRLHLVKFVFLLYAVFFFRVEFQYLHVNEEQDTSHSSSLWLL